MRDITERLRERPYRLANETEDQSKIRRQREREEAAELIEFLRCQLQRSVSDEMVDMALNAWFASPPSETDQGLARSMRAALEAARVVPQ